MLDRNYRGIDSPVLSELLEQAQHRCLFDVGVYLVADECIFHDGFVSVQFLEALDTLIWSNVLTRA